MAKKEFAMNVELLIEFLVVLVRLLSAGLSS